MARASRKTTPTTSIHIAIPTELHTALKTMSAQRRMTLKAFCIEVLTQATIQGGKTMKMILIAGVILALCGTFSTPVAAQNAYAVAGDEAKPDTGILSQVTTMFREATLNWGPVISTQMETIMFDLVTLEMAILGIVLVFHVDIGSWFSTLVHMLIGSGFCLWGVRSGGWYIEQVFAGVKELSRLLGGPPIDPSAVAAWGWVVSDAIFKTLADQGFLSWATHPGAWMVGVLAQWSLLLAFVILGLQLMGRLIISYLLVASTGFFLCFGVLRFTRPLTMGWVRMVFATMASLFFTLLIVAVANELGALLQQSIQAMFSDAAKSYTWADYMTPAIVGLVLCGLFAWLPGKFGAMVGEVVADWGGGAALMGYARGGASAAYSAGQSVSSIASQSGASLGVGGGGGGAGAGGASGGMAKPQPVSSAWGRHP